MFSFIKGNNWLPGVSKARPKNVLVDVSAQSLPASVSRWWCCAALCANTLLLQMELFSIRALGGIRSHREGVGGHA